MRREGWAEEEDKSLAEEGCSQGKGEEILKGAGSKQRLKSEVGENSMEGGSDEEISRGRLLVGL